MDESERSYQKHEGKCTKIEKSAMSDGIVWTLTTKES